MKKKGLFTFICMLLLSALVLSGCGFENLVAGNKGEEGKEDKEEVNLEELAKRDANTLLAYLYEGKKGNIKDVTGMDGDDLTASLERSVYEKKIRDYPGDDWVLLVDGSRYTAEQIMQDYSRVYLKTFHSITYSVEDVKISNDTAEVTAKIDPIAMLSLANRITQARAEVFGDLETSAEILKSQNKDVKAINNLINFKLYSMIYGDQNKPVPTVGEEKEITFTMKKSGDHFQVSKDTIEDIMQDSMEDVYSKSSGDK